MRTRMSLLFVALLACVACSRDEPATPAAPAAPAATPTAATPTAATPAPVKESVFTQEELAQMVAPIALYPDPLLAQVLMAATYPGDVADAAAWSKANPKAQGDAAVRQVANEPWDPSVQSLVAFPQALAVLGQDPGWVQRLGDAFLAQPDDVMDAVQRLRRQAQSAGNLESNEYQKVSEVAPQAAPVESAPAVGGATTTEYIETSPDIIIQPSDPQTIYVPSYNPTQVYGTWAYPSYPPPYYPPASAWYPMGGALASGLAFGVGLAITDSLWGDCDWGSNDVNIDVDRYNSINTNRQIDRGNNTWQHNSLNRDGVPYRDNYNREMNGNRLAGAENREAFRGDNAERTRSREQARASMQSRGLEPARDNQQARAGARDAMDRATPEQRERAQAAARDRGAPQTRDAQRERAQAAQRDRAQAAQRDRAQAQQRDRAQTQQRDRAQAQQRQQQQRARQTQSNSQARSAAQRQAHANRAPSNNAFSGAGGRSQQQHAAAQRGQRSSAAAQRPQQQRSQGHQVNRQPQQRSGGQHASRSSGGSRQPSSGGGRRR